MENLQQDLKQKLHEKLARDHESQKKWWRLRRARMTIGILALLGILGAALWWFVFHPFVSTDDARVAATLIRIAPDAVSGKVVQLSVTEGSEVKKGDVLVQLDTRLSQARLEKAKAQADLNDRNLSRVSRLVSESGLPAKDLDVARANAEIAHAELSLAQTTFDNDTIRSPIDGVVIQKNIEQGDVVEPGQSLLTVADVDHAWVAANIEETSIGSVNDGQSVHITIDEGGTLTGKVSEIRYSVASQFALIPTDSGAGNFTKVVQRVPIKIALDPHDARKLRAGQSVEIKIRIR